MLLAAYIQKHPLGAGRPGNNGGRISSCCRQHKGQASHNRTTSINQPEEKGEGSE